MCCCGTGQHHGHWQGKHHAGGCECGEGFRFGRCLATKEEKIAWFEQYLQELQEQTKAVEEHIAALKKE